MTRRVNKRGWCVLVSVASADNARCVDVFEHPDGGFGFQQFRSDPEDQGTWTPIGGAAQPDYDSARFAATAARREVTWLCTDLGAQQQLADWEAALP